MNKYRVCAASFAVAAVVAFAGCTGNSGADNANTPPVRVKVKGAALADGSQAMAYSGTIEESESIPLSFSVVGTVARVLVAEGDAVTKGQPLAELNKESFSGAYEMSAATLRQAEDAYKRLQSMYKNGNLPEVRFVEVEADLQRARSATAIARKNLDDCVLISPVNGIVGKRSIEPGMNAIPNVTSITLVRVGKVFARVSVPEREIPSIRKGQKAAITVGALDNAGFTGHVEEVGVLADPLVHTYKVRIGIANPGFAIKPGMICTVLMEQTGSVRSIVIPGEAVMVDEGGRAYVYAIDTAGTRVKRTYVQPGALLNDGIEVLEGLHAHDRVVVSGQHKLIDGATVQIITN